MSGTGEPGKWMCAGSTAETAVALDELTQLSVRKGGCFVDAWSWRELLGE
jgi:hypothetical protein